MVLTETDADQRSIAGDKWGCADVLDVTSISEKMRMYAQQLHSLAKMQAWQTQLQWHRGAALAG
jgi:hypothetical protein